MAQLLSTERNGARRDEHHLPSARHHLGDLFDDRRQSPERETTLILARDDRRSEFYNDARGVFEIGASIENFVRVMR